MVSLGQIPPAEVHREGCSRWYWITWLPLAVVVVAGGWLRLEIAASELIWLDELHTSWALQSGVGEMLTRSAQGNQAPLFFSLAWGVVACLGTSELTLRLVSVVSGSLLMLLAAKMVWGWTRSGLAATVAASLIAVDDTFIWYATEARPYALLHLLSLLQFGAYLGFVNQLRSESEKRVQAMMPWTFVLFSLSLLYTHYTSVFLLAAELVSLLLLLVFRSLVGKPVQGSFLFTVVLTSLAIVVGASPLSLQMGQAFGRPDDWKAVASTSQFVDEQGMNLLAWFLLPVTSVVAIWLFSSPGSISLSNGKATSLIDEKRGNRSLLLCAMATIYFLPCVLLYELTKADVIPIALSRYLSSSIVAGPVFAVAVLGTLQNKKHWLAGSVFIAATLSLNVSTGRFVTQFVKHGQVPQMRNENWPVAIDRINQTSEKSSHPVLLFGSVIEDASSLGAGSEQFQRYLQFPLNGLYPVDQNSRFVLAGPTVNAPHFDAATVNKVIECGGAWVLVRHHRSHARSIASELLTRLASGENSTDASPTVAEFDQENGLIQLISIDLN